MENKYLNLTGAVYIISKIKTLLEDKSDKGHTHSKEEIGLGNVENKSSQTIRGELTSDNVIKALGYTPPKENTTYAVMKGATASAAGTQDWYLHRQLAIMESIYEGMVHMEHRQIQLILMQHRLHMVLCQ